MNVLVVGNTCTGKSALINKLIGKDVAEEAEDKREKCIHHYSSCMYYTNAVVLVLRRGCVQLKGRPTSRNGREKVATSFQHHNYNNIVCISCP